MPINQINHHFYRSIRDISPNAAEEPVPSVMLRFPNCLSEVSRPTSTNGFIRPGQALAIHQRTKQMASVYSTSRSRESHVPSRFQHPGLGMQEQETLQILAKR